MKSSKLKELCSGWLIETNKHSYKSTIPKIALNTEVKHLFYYFKCARLKKNSNRNQLKHFKNPSSHN